MKLIFCTGVRGEMLFNQRRVSRDKNIICDIEKLVGDGIIYMDAYSEELFEDAQLNIIVSSEPYRNAEADDFVFLEKSDPRELLDRADTLIIYNFERRYPYDLKFDTPLDELGFSALGETEFAGNAHDKITRYIFVRS